jgi:hypothetical protein
MKSGSQYKCLHCKEIHRADYRNRGRQQYCAKPECRRASKAHSQGQWLSKPENQDHFRGPENSERVRQWRQAHPGYWRKKRSVVEEPLQETCSTQSTQNQEVVSSSLLPVPDALQDICSVQPALLVGLISAVTGYTLQEDIAASTRSLLTRGEDILRMNRGIPSGVGDEKADIMSGADPRGALAI